MVTFAKVGKKYEVEWCPRPGVWKCTITEDNGSYINIYAPTLAAMEMFLDHVDAGARVCRKQEGRNHGETN